MAYEEEKKYLRNAAAKRVEYGSNPQTGDKQLARRWGKVKDDLQASSLTYLNTLTTVENPQADKRAYPGVWRIIQNRGPRMKTNPSEQGIYQTLRHGYLTEIDATPAAVHSWEAENPDSTRSIHPVFANQLRKLKRKYVT